jgi:hypothetical protein
LLIIHIDQAVPHFSGDPLPLGGNVLVGSLTAVTVQP